MSKYKRSHALALVQKYFPQVTTVTDADENAVIEVTKQDSTGGARKDHAHCALAKACQRSFEARGVIVSLSTVYIIKKEGAIRYRVPESVAREIVSFDRKAEFAEGEYHLCKPNHAHRLGRPWQGRSHKNTGQGKKPKHRHFTGNIRARLGSDTLK